MSDIHRELRFWKRVVMSDGCWEWSGAHLYRRHHGGRQRSYGSVRWNGRQTGAHRVAYELAHGPIPAGMLVLHRCDNQGCVRPEHLYLGTHADNTRDAVERSRMERGSARYNARLNEEAVRAIRLAIHRGEATEKIGARFGISGRTVRYIRDGRRWAHVA